MEQRQMRTRGYLVGTVPRVNYMMSQQFEEIPEETSFVTFMVDVPVYLIYCN